MTIRTVKASASDTLGRVGDYVGFIFENYLRQTRDRICAGAQIAPMSWAS
jgi:hypothetical protein